MTRNPLTNGEGGVQLRRRAGGVGFPLALGRLSHDFTLPELREGAGARRRGERVSIAKHQHLRSPRFHLSTECHSLPLVWVQRMQVEEMWEGVQERGEALPMRSRIFRLGPGNSHFAKVIVSSFRKLREVYKAPVELIQRKGVFFNSPLQTHLYIAHYQRYVP